MLAKIGSVIGAIALATFMMGRAESLTAHCGFGGSTVWAEQWDDTAGDASPQDDFVAQPDSLPDVSGSYSGSVESHRFGSGTLSATISQGGPSGGSLSGGWGTDLDGGIENTLKGKVKPNSKVSLKLKISGHCGLVAHGTFKNGDEISGKYHSNGCGRPDHGTFDIFD